MTYDSIDYYNCTLFNLGHNENGNETILYFFSKLHYNYN